MNRLNIGIAVFILIALEAIAYAVEIMFRHGFDTAWPTHARYHLMVSAVQIVAIAIVSVVIALTGLRKRSRDSWLALAVLSLITWAGWPLARLVTGEPTPAPAILFIAGCLAAVLVALALTYSPCFSKDDGRKP